MAMLKALSPATRTSTDFGLWGTVVASLAEPMLQPNELQDLAIVVYGVVSAFSMSSLPDTALVFVVLILCLLIVPVRPYHCQTVDVSEMLRICRLNELSPYVASTAQSRNPCA